MKVHGIQVQEGSNISNLTVASGTSFPAAPNAGELFYRSDADTRVRGLYLYVDTWGRIASADALSVPIGTSFPSLANAGDLFYKNTNDSAEGLYVFNDSSWVPASSGAGSTIPVTGDVTGTLTVGSSSALTLGTVNVNTGSQGSASTILVITVNGKGLITAVVPTSIAITASQTTSGTFADARIAASNVTQHQAALALAASQTTSGTFADARIAASNVTQHQAALTILETQITDGALLARNASNETIAGAWTFSQPIVGSTPVGGSNLTTKDYVDQAIAGLSWKNSVRVATTANITLSGTQTIDGVSIVATNRVLVKNQSTQSQNGVYVAAAGAWARAADFDQTAPVDEVNSAAVFVQIGTTQADTAWTQVSPVAVVDTDAMTFAQFSGSNLFSAGTGLTLTGNTFDVGTASASRIVVNPDNIDLALVTDAGTGTFSKITRDSYGRVSGTTQVLVGDITSLLSYTGDVSTAGTVATLAIVNTSPVTASFSKVTTNGKGLVTATTPVLAADITALIPYTGDVSSSGLVLTLGTVNSAPVIASFSKVTTNGKGLVTATTPVLAADITGILSYTGDATTSGTTLTLATVNVGPVTASFSKVTTNGKGLVTATTPVLAADITALVDATYVNVSGDTMSGNLLTSGILVAGNTTTFTAHAATLTLTYPGLSTQYGIVLKPTAVTTSTLAIDFLTSTSTAGTATTLGAIQHLAADAGLNLIGTWTYGGSAIQTATSVAANYVAKSGDTMSGNLILNNNVYLTSKTSGGTSTRMFGINASNTMYLGSIDAATGGDWIFINGTERMRIDAAGNVGIGASSPASVLHVVVNNASRSATFETTSSATSAIMLKNTGSGAAPAQLLSISDALGFQTAGSERVRITSTGDVGIGVTGPAARLHIASAGSVTPQLILQRTSETGGYSWLLFSRTDGSRALELIVNSSAASYGIPVNAAGLNAQGSNGLHFSTADTLRMSIDGIGNVGIGGTPANRLDVFHTVTGIGARVRNSTTGIELAIRTDATTSGIDAGNASGGMTFSINSAEKMRLDTSGNLGIGITPAKKLHVFNSTTVISDTQLMLEGGGAGYGAGITFQSVLTGGARAEMARITADGESSWNTTASTQDAGLRFFTTKTGVNAERMRIGADGAVMVGTSSGLNTSSKLRVYATSAVNTEFYSTGSIVRLTLANDNNLNAIESNAGSLVFYRNTGSIVEAARIDGSGRFGVGKVPAFGGPGAIDALGGVHAQSITANNTPDQFETNGGAVLSYSGSGLGALAAYANSSGQGASTLTFQTAPAAGALTERMRIDSAGNLLVGTILASGNGFKVLIDGTGAYVQSKRNTATGTTHIEFANTNGVVGTITTSGSATAYNTSSDVRLKENIVDAPSPGAIIDAMQVREFDFKTGGHVKHGFIAQELYSVAPEAVHVGGEDETTNPWGVDYSALVPILLKEIQELRARVAMLETK